MPAGAIRGFKEIRWFSREEHLTFELNSSKPNLRRLPRWDPAVLVRFAAMLFPCSRFVFNVRSGGNKSAVKLVSRRNERQQVAAAWQLHMHWQAKQH